MSIQAVSLYCRDGGSDKVYHAQIEEVSGGFVVNFQYGRRGSTLQTGAKTTSPVERAKAQKIFDKLVQEKMAKGYTEGADGTPYAGTEKAGQVSGNVPQLLNSITEDLVQHLLSDDDWLMQEKKDGVRQMINFDRGSIVGSNRKGLIVPLTKAIESSVTNLIGGGVALIDGETIGDYYHVFDLLELDDEDFRPYGTLERYDRLTALYKAAPDDEGYVVLVEAAGNTADKRAMFERLKAARAEGVVFKRKNAPYVPGRPNSGGNQLKYKFKASATCTVLKQNESKRSVALTMNVSDGTADEVAIGNVTVPANYNLPAVGSLVEVEYLYAFPGGSLFQPVYKGVRTDKTVADQITTLKYKQGTTDDEEG